jgi:hypothetical protein
MGPIQGDPGEEPVREFGGVARMGLARRAQSARRRRCRCTSLTTSNTAIATRPSSSRNPHAPFGVRRRRGICGALRSRALHPCPSAPPRYEIWSEKQVRSSALCACSNLKTGIYRYDPLHERRGAGAHIREHPGSAPVAAGLLDWQKRDA